MGGVPHPDAALAHAHCIQDAASAHNQRCCKRSATHSSVLVLVPVKCTGCILSKGAGSILPNNSAFTRVPTGRIHLLAKNAWNTRPF